MRNIASWLSGAVFVAVVALTLFATSAKKFAIPEQELFLEMKIRSAGQAGAVLYHDFRNEGRLYEEDVTQFMIPYSPMAKPAKFALPKLPIRFMRIDLNAPQGEVAFSDLRVTNEKGETIRAMAPEEIESINPETDVQRQGSETVARWQTAAGTPMLWLNIEYPIHPVLNPHRVTAGQIAFLWLVMSLTALAGLFTMLRDFMRPVSPEGAPADAWRPALMWLSATALIMVGAKLWLVNEYGSDLPHWDSWELEGWALLAPFQDGALSWQVMFENINEHRVFFTRLLSLGLFLVSGQWDARLGMTANALLHSAAGLGLCLLLWQMFRRRNLVFLAVLSLLAFAMPFAWENTLWATQSQFYFLVLLAVPTIWLLGTNPPLSARWWMGLTLSVCCLFTVSSGSLAAAAVAGFMILKIARDWKNWKQPAITLAACVVVLILAKHFAVTEKAHAGWMAHGFKDFMSTFSKTGAWPLVNMPWMMPVMWLPFILLVIYYLLHKEDKDRLVELLMGLGIWIAVQVLTIGLFRGGGGAGPESRHMDSMSLGLVVNGASALALAGRIGKLKIPIRFWNWFVPAWWVLAVVGMLSLTSKALLQDIPRWKAYNDRCAVVVDTFLRSNKIGDMLNAPDDGLPYVRWVMPAFLRNRHVREMMPASVGTPLSVEAAGPSLFSENGLDPSMPKNPARKSWGSYTAPGRQSQQFTMTSKVIPPPAFPFLQFEVAGDLGEDNLSLDLRELSSGRVTPIAPPVKPGSAWQAVMVRSPVEPFVIEAVDAHPGNWFAFQEPTGISRVSGWAEKLLNHASWLLFGGMALIIFTAVHRRMTLMLAPSAKLQPAAVKEDSGQKSRPATKVK
ncbi:MAG: hypothetical protein V2A34_02820 [Lentisphaerota bacterium]